MKAPLKPPSRVDLSKSLILLLALLTALDSVSIDMYLPGMPEIARQFNVSTGRAQQTLAAFLVGLAIGQGIYGPFLDRYGRRIPLIVGLIIFVGGSVLAALSPSIEFLIIARFIQAIGASAGLVTPRAVVADLFDVTQSARIFSILMQVMMISPILAPVIGGWLLHAGGWRASFWVLAGVGSAALLWVWWRCPESLPTHRRKSLNPRSIWNAYTTQLMNPVFLAYSLAGGFALASLFAYISTSAFIFTQEFELSASQFSYLFAFNSVALILGGQVSHQMLKRGLTERNVTAIGLVVHSASGLALAICVLALPPSLLLHTGLLAAATGALGLVFGNVTALTMDHAGNQAGVASALMGSLQYLLSAVVGFFVSAAPAGLVTLPATIGICGIAAGALCLYSRRRIPRASQPQPR
ncbi:multidrug effflux MFS transporter [Variovorax sp. RT4R15]|uniref:multidrug effflux MFS transporter n=1 Tax=Variovorax sp. RT4R15 TaxID=3443737 RepID=UPI003F4917B1